MFIFFHFGVSVTLACKPFTSQYSNKNIQVQVDQSNYRVVIHFDGVCEAESVMPCTFAGYVGR